MSGILDGNSTELFPVSKFSYGNLERVLFQFYALLLNRKYDFGSKGTWGLEKLGSQYLKSLKTNRFYMNNLTILQDL